MGESDAAIESYRLAAAELERVGATREAATLWRELAEALESLELTDLALTAYRKMAAAYVGRSTTSDVVNRSGGVTAGQ
jgi:hypothetical protein